VSKRFFTLEKHSNLYVARCKLCEYRAISPSEREAIAMMYNHYHEVHETITHERQQASERGERHGK
jgi:transcription elongation factor Elf1